MADPQSTNDSTTGAAGSGAETGKIADAVARAVADDTAQRKPEPAADAPEKVAATGTSENGASPRTAAPSPTTAPKNKAAPKKAAAKKSPPRKAGNAKTANQSKPRAAAKATSGRAPTARTNSTKNTRNHTMANTQKTKTSPTGINMGADVQDRMQAAYAKANEFSSEAGEFGKENVEAMVESGKIFFSGAQSLMQEEFETGKTVVDTLTEDAKKAASVKSPTDLMQMQSEITRRNFDAMMSYGSQRTEAWVKLYNEAFAPISNRVSVATEKLSKVA